MKFPIIFEMIANSEHIFEIRKPVLNKMFFFFLIANIQSSLHNTQYTCFCKSENNNCSTHCEHMGYTAVPNIILHGHKKLLLYYLDMINFIFYCLAVRCPLLGINI